MNFAEAFKVIDDRVFACRGRHLTVVEKVVLEAAWEDKGYKEVAQASSYNSIYLQRFVGPKLWNLLSAVLGNGEKVTKKRLRAILEQTQTTQSCNSLSDISSSTEDTLLHVMGGQPPDVSSFYGRIPDLAMLGELIVEDHCVVLIGTAGIGKSALAAKLLEVVRTQPQSRFDCFIWKSIHYGPSLPDLVVELIKLLAPCSELDLPESTHAKISVLIGYLQSRRRLLVLDAAEVLLQGDRNTSFNPYGEKYAEYGAFFRRIVEEQHQSCLLLTSREPFIDITHLQRKGQPARVVKIEGLGNSAMQILRAKGLTDEEQWGDLIQTYRGNPLALQMVASRIQDFFGGRVAEFLNCKTTFMSDLFQETLDEQFGTNGRLTNLEKKIMVYLAEELAREPESIKFTQLLSNININYQTKASTSELIEALEALGERSLIEKTKSPNEEVLLSLQPVIKKYVLTDPSGLIRECDTDVMPSPPAPSPKLGRGGRG